MKNVVNRASISLNRIITVLLLFLALSLALILVVSSTVREFSAAINDSGRVRGGIQKTLVTALSGESIEADAAFIDNVISSLSSFTGRYSLLFSSADIRRIDSLNRRWSEARSVISRGVGVDVPMIKTLSDELWTLADENVSAIEQTSRRFINFLYVAIFIISTAIIALLLLIVVVRKLVSERIENQASRDQLTGMYNRNFFKEIVDHRIHELSTESAFLVVVLCDIDHFKSINDTRGHDEGDRILKKTADSIQGAIRESDIAFRYGGEEFLVLGNIAQAADIAAFCERIRSRVESDSAGDVSISVGAVIHPPRSDIQASIKAADTALYEAKHAGRNRVVIAGS